ncbi:MAG: hypothetical protein SGPRY_001499 [Prymnesium sp.]
MKAGELNAMLGEQRRSLDESSSTLSLTFPPASQGGIISFQEAKMAMVLRHMQDVMLAYATGIDYIEGLLRSQLIAAIGKEVSSDDFNRYMRHHEERTFVPGLAPQPFCFAVRRPGMYPEGTVSIERWEMGGGEGEGEPICTWSRQVEGPPMTFRLSAATSVEFTGE